MNPETAPLREKSAEAKSGVKDEPPPAYNIPSTFAKVLTDIPPSQHSGYELLLKTFGSIFGFCGAYIPCCCCTNPFQVVQQGQVGLISHFGKVYRVVDPGLYFVNTLTEGLTRVDIMINITDVPRQTVMTRDNVSISIDSVIYWHIIDPFVAKFNVGDVAYALLEKAQTTLKDTIGAHDLQSVIGNRHSLAYEIKKIIEEPAKRWGVMIESILIKDFTFTKELLDNLSSAARQKRIAEGRIIAARAEVESAKLMREASDILNTPSAMQIRYLETIGTMSKSCGNSIIFMPSNYEEQLKAAKK